MTRTALSTFFAWLLIASMPVNAAAADLASSFANPPESDRPWVYWWWLDGAASKEGITRDLEEMRRQGIGGVLLVDAGQGGPDAPKGPAFMSDPWRENFRHAVREAGRLGLVMSVNLCSGWNAGGPWIQLEDTIKHLVTSEISVEGPQKIQRVLPQPRTEHGWYRDIAVLACRVQNDKTWSRDAQVDLTARMRDGRLEWNVTEGRWTIMRFGYTVDSGKTVYGVSARTKCGSGPESEGWEVDPWSRRAMERHFEATAGKLIEDAGSLTGKTLAQLHIDSWETVEPSWTDDFLDEFRARRGYDARPFLPALGGKIVDGPEITARFRWDFRRTAADLYAANYFGRLGELGRPHGLGQDSESGGPFFFQSVDGLQCQGINEVPMGEFWKRNWEPDGPVFGTPEFWGYDSVRQAASAAHIYGREICQAEAFTSFGEDWIEDPWCLKDIGDQAFCNGLTRMVFHKFTHQPHLDAVPGCQWEHVGTHINANTTWWNMSHAWLQYLRRCQFMLRQGLHVADLAYYYGEDANTFVRSKTMMNPPLPPGFDCDTLNAEVLLERASVQNGRLLLPDGMAYRCLVLPHTNSWKASPPVLRKLAELVEGGLTVIGPSHAPHAPGLTDYPTCDDEVRQLVEKLWGADLTASGERRTGKGRVLWGKTAAAVLAAEGVCPDVEFLDSTPEAKFDWIHRRITGTDAAFRSGQREADIYFISNQRSVPSAAEVAFRTVNRQPELWDAVTGTIRPLPEFRHDGARILIPMSFEPRESFFVVFREPISVATKPGKQNFPKSEKIGAIAGPWDLSFNPKWGGPEKVTFETLQDWTKRTEKGIRYYSGTAVYRKTFDLPQGAGKQQAPVYLSLGTVKNLARVTLNGRDLGVVWTAPWRVEITSAMRAKSNQLEIAVVNLWPNRLIGDAGLPPNERFTKTNVKTYEGVPPATPLPGGCKACDERKKNPNTEQPLFPSGLLGPVTLEIAGGAGPVRQRFP